MFAENFEQPVVSQASRNYQGWGGRRGWDKKHKLKLPIDRSSRVWQMNR